MFPLPFRRRPGGFSQEALDSCVDEINAYNAQTFSIVSLVSVFLLAACSLIPLLIEKDRVIFLLYLLVGGLELAIYGCSVYVNRSKKYSVPVFYILFTLFYALLMSPTFYIGVFSHPDRHAVMAILFLLYSQAFFVVDIQYSIALNLVTGLLFTFLTLRMKVPVIREIDVVHIWIAVALALALNRYLRYVVVRDLLSSRRLEIERDRFREESIKDELTGLSNRREYHNAAKFHISVCQHVHQTICAIMLDVDFFKKYNDHYGHQKGDDTLKAIGAVLKQLVVEEQIFASRVGGEEFFVLWTENRVAEAERVAIRLCQMIIDLKIPHERSEVAPYVTVSLGIYMLRGGSKDTVEDLYREADTALYEAKARGRNCIMLRDSADRSLRMVKLLPPEENLGRKTRPAPGAGAAGDPS